jgi:hypothetical protein
VPDKAPDFLLQEYREEAAARGVCSQHRNEALAVERPRSLVAAVHERELNNEKARR